MFPTLSSLRVLCSCIPFFKSLTGCNKRVLYFGFGANADDQTLRRRGIEVFRDEEFILKDYQLTFSHQTGYEDMGYATIMPEPGKVVWCRLFEISILDLWHLELFELSTMFHRYERTQIEQDEKKIFYFKSNHLSSNVHPTKDYLEKIISAAKKGKKTPHGYIDILESTKTGTPGNVRRHLCYAVKNYPYGPKWLVSILEVYDRFVFRSIIQMYPYRVISKSNQ